MADIDNSEDILDPRDIEERIDDLEGEEAFLIIAFEEAGEALEEARAEWGEADAITQHNGVDPSGELTANRDAAAEALVSFWKAEDHKEPGETTQALATRLLDAYRAKGDAFDGLPELATLKALRDEFKDYCPDWDGGTTLIRYSYWTEYVQELLADIGDLPRDLPSYIEIDWEATSRNIKVDYTEGDFDGVTYYAR